MPRRYALQSKLHNAIILILKNRKIYEAPGFLELLFEEGVSAERIVKGEYGWGTVVLNECLYMKFTLCQNWAI